MTNHPESERSKFERRLIAAATSIAAVAFIGLLVLAFA